MKKCYFVERTVLLADANVAVAEHWHHYMEACSVEADVVTHTTLLQVYQGAQEYSRYLLLIAQLHDTGAPADAVLLKIIQTGVFQWKFHRVQGNERPSTV